MKKRNGIKIICLLAVCLFAWGFFLPAKASAAGTEVYLGGMPAGFILETKGAGVIGLCEVAGDAGQSASPAKDAGVRVGDILISMAGKEVNNAKDIEESLAGADGSGMPFVYRRQNKDYASTVYPAKDFAGNYKLGVFVRDTLTGIGTVTYVRKDNLRFGALGHPVIGQDGVTALDVRSGNLYRCNVIDVKKGEKGSAGELKGIFLRDKVFALADKNTAAGIFGKVNEDAFEGAISMQTSSMDEVKPGKATVYTTVGGSEPAEYEISIVKADKGAKDNKNFVIKITDKTLLSRTAGILQGMSGSPIVQNGKLIGAVTHVFLNDPTRGFGIGIENMLKE